MLGMGIGRRVAIGTSTLALDPRLDGLVVVRRRGGSDARRCACRRLGSSAQLTLSFAPRAYKARRGWWNGAACAQLWRRGCDFERDLGTIGRAGRPDLCVAHLLGCIGRV